MNPDKIHHIYFKQDDNKYRVYDPHTNYGTFKTVEHKEYRQIKKHYKMLAGYEASDKGLIAYYNDFKIWNKELIEHYNQHKSHLTWFYFKDSNDLNIIETFYNFSRHIYDFKSNKYDIITYLESSYFEWCNNGGLMYCEAGTYDCFGYDYNSFFPRLLGESKFKLQIPLNSGKEYKLIKLDYNNIKFGFYKVKIECDNKMFFFNYSKDNVYTHYSLLDAIKYQQKFNIKITLINDSEYNAYLYEDSDLIYTHQVFGNWFNELNGFKQKHPKNKLIKHLMSSLWGSLSKKNITYVKEDDLEEYDYGLSDKDMKEYVLKSSNNNLQNEYYTLIKREQPYKYNIRLKPFLLSYSRSIMTDIAYNNHPQEIIRIMVDNICYKSNVSFNVENMCAEEKSTGLINFKNVMKFTFMCKKCLIDLPRGGHYCSACSVGN
jgi:hypothetical protein